MTPRARVNRRQRGDPRDGHASGLEQVDAAVKGPVSAVRDVTSVNVLAEFLPENLKSVALRKGARRSRSRGDAWASLGCEEPNAASLSILLDCTGWPCARPSVAKTWARSLWFSRQDHQAWAWMKALVAHRRLGKAASDKGGSSAGSFRSR